MLRWAPLLLPVAGFFAAIIVAGGNTGGALDATPSPSPAYPACAPLLPLT